MQRTSMTLDGVWELFPDPDDRLSPTALGPGGRPTRVPGPWQAQHADLRAYAGVAWYRRSFEGVSVPGRRVFLHFGAVDYHATVWLNGQPLGEHEGGYLPFELDATAALRAGPNELVVRVLDPADNGGPFPFDEIPHGKQSWYGPLGGIWQSVHLESRSPLHLTRLRITPDLAGERAAVAVGLSEAAPHGALLELALTDPAGAVTRATFPLAAGEQAAEVSLPVPDPLLWDVETPNLYRLTAALLVAGETLDTCADSFGMRAIGVSPAGLLLLNGRPLYLRGALDQDYYPDLVATAFSDAELDDQFAKARALGLNCVRTHIKIADPRYYAAADRAGLLVWTELPNWITLSEAAKRRAWETLAGMVERDWNHPSIVIWTIINEGWGVDLAHNRDHRVWLAATYAALKELDPHRLIVGNSACHGNFHVATDIEDYHNYYAIPDHYEKWRDWVRSFAGRPFWSFAHAYESSASWKALLEAPWAATPRAAAPEVRRGGAEPLVVSEFGNWGLPDLGPLYAAYGGEPWWFETGHDWGDGVVYPHGVEQRFRDYRLDRAFGDMTGLAAASQRLQGLALKYQIEQMRLQPSIAGYIITELTDVHWEANGLLDMCRNPKRFAASLAQVNADDLIIPVCARAAGQAGETLEAELSLSHFSRRDLRGARLEWGLEGYPEIGGAIVDLEPRQYGVTELGSIRLTLPEVSSSALARLTLRLIGPDGALAAANEQELAILAREQLAPPGLAISCPDPELAALLTSLGYQVRGQPEEADVVLATRLTDGLRDYLQRGGRVLFLAESETAMDTYMGNYLLGQLQIVARKGTRWQGDWASSLTWLRRDTLFGAIPSGGVADMSFADLTPDYVIRGLGAHEFAGAVHAGLFVGWVHSPVAIVAERQVGQGRLMLSTFRLRDHIESHPLARALLNAMLRGIARDPARHLHHI